MTTPMRRQYLQLKSEHPDCILFFRLGDFYETFDGDAEIVAEVCDVALTSRPVGSNQRVPLAGVPYHSVEGYLAQMVEAGYKVAIAEQVSEPGAGLVEREVQQVVTKGTIVEPSMLDDDRNNYLVAVLFNARGDEAGIAYCDITTGEFAATQINGSGYAETERRLEEELGRLQPSELITSEWNAEESGLAPLIHNLHALVSQVEPWQVELDAARAALQRHLRVTSLDGFGLHQKPQAVRAAAAVLAYLQEMQPSALSQLTRLHSYTLSEFMVLDESTRRNLELTETMRGGAVTGSLLGVLDETLTPMGGRLLRRWLGRPLLDVARIHQRLDAVQSLVEDADLRLQMRDALRGMGDLERWINRITQGKALPRDLLGVRELLRRSPALRALLGANREENESLPLPALPDCLHSLELLERAIADEPSATLAAPGIIRPGYNDELDAILHNSRHAKEWVASLEQVERDPHADAHRPLLEEVELRRRVVLLAHEQGAAGAGLQAQARAQSREVRGSLARGRGLGDFPGVAGHVQDAALVAGEVHRRGADAAEPVGAQVGEGAARHGGHLTRSRRSRCRRARGGRRGARSGP